MRWNALTIASVLLLPTAAYADDLADDLFAQTSPTRPASPGPAQTAPSRPASPTATQQAEMKKYLVFFDWDKATLTPEARRIIANAAEDFKKSGSARIVATGHTDTSGSPAYNMQLSIRRAEAVKAELVRLGVPASDITTIGRGEEDLLVPTKDGVREAQNRRVSIEFPVPPKAVAAPPPAPKEAAAPPPPPPPPLKWAAQLGPWYGYNIKESDKDNRYQSNLVGGEVQVEYYPTPEVGLKVSQVGYNTIDSSLDNGWGGRTAIGVDLTGNYGTVHPYIGANIGGYYGKGVQDGFMAGPEIGAKFDLTRQWYLYAKAAYDYSFRNGWDEGIPNGGLGAGYRW